ncbi:unnamed protein product [Rangifer tarandus platyrhynchus]|uniref:Uncharacterized protein n=2 Tax=Rangifer tarandus platyrhynchus TaxID=3082113 RepID=A0ABN8Z2G8_RANTA|nr:unnamed protein product [Rangifer tarandus platyrhynchus]CAI9703184.1 unnamed protein product [Rangifer tarandus platyrhynchus]
MTSDTSGAGSARCTEKAGSAQGLSTPSPAHKVLRKRSRAQKLPEPRVISRRRAWAAWTGLGSFQESGAESSPPDEALLFPEKQRNQALPTVLPQIFRIKTFFKSVQTKPN